MKKMIYIGVGGENISMINDSITLFLFDRFITISFYDRYRKTIRKKFFYYYDKNKFNELKDWGGFCTQWFFGIHFLIKIK